VGRLAPLTPGKGRRRRRQEDSPRIKVPVTAFVRFRIDQGIASGNVKDGSS
jgi:hypothetical protein